MALRVGDEVIVSLAPARARVSEVSPRSITIEWPWGERDDSSCYRWDGRSCLPWGESTTEWVPYQVEASAGSGPLRAGDTCIVSIPPTRLHVEHYEEYDRPRNFGWAPAPTAGLYVVPAHRLGVFDGGCMLYLGGAEPVQITLAS